VTDYSPQTSSGQGQRDGAHYPCVAGIFLGVSFVALQSHRPGNEGHVAIGKYDSYGLQVQLSAPAARVQLIDSALDKCPRRDHHLIAGSHRRSDLRVNVISAMNDAALYGMREHERNPGAGRNAYNILLRWR
jgi:hypothetical protein